jgi:hypothetical protein
VLEPGAIFVGTAPADTRLWSRRGETLHRVRRYQCDECRALFPPTEWDAAHLEFTNGRTYPAVWAIRRLRRKQTNRDAPAPRSEDRV